MRTIRIYHTMQKADIKKQVGLSALQFVKEGMVVGLGTGSTAEEFIKCLAESKKKITGVATSKNSEKLAQSLGILCLPIDRVSHIDITFDGADEVDSKKRMIKGAGGALLRE